MINKLVIIYEYDYTLKQIMHHYTYVLNLFVNKVLFWNLFKKANKNIDYGLSASYCDMNFKKQFFLIGFFANVFVMHCNNVTNK